mgnify:CR=1 FL=1
MHLLSPIRLFVIAIVVFGFGAVAYARPATSAARPAPASSAAAFACGLFVATPFHYSPGTGDDFQINVTVSGGSACRYVVRSMPDWIDVTDITNSSFRVVVHPNWTVQRATSFVVNGAVRQGDVTSETDISYNVTVTQGAGS